MIVHILLKSGCRSIHIVRGGKSYNTCLAPSPSRFGGTYTYVFDYSLPAQFGAVRTVRIEPSQRFVFLRTLISNWAGDPGVIFVCLWISSPRSQILEYVYSCLNNDTSSDPACRPVLQSDPYSEHTRSKIA